MSKDRRQLSQILGQFEEGNDVPQTEIPEQIKSNESLAAQLANPKKKTTKIRFTLDLEKPLDDRLTKSAKSLNRSKADIARIAIERLLGELEQ